MNDMSLQVQGDELLGTIKKVISDQSFVDYIKIITQNVSYLLQEVRSEADQIDNLKLIKDSYTLDSHNYLEVKDRQKEANSIFEKFIRKGKLNVSDLNITDEKKVLSLIIDSLDDYLGYTLLTEVSSKNKGIYDAFTKTLQDPNFSMFSLLPDKNNNEDSIQGLHYYKMKLCLNLANIKDTDLKRLLDGKLKFPDKINFEVQIKSQFVSIYSNIEHSALYKNTVVSFNDSAITKLFLSISKNVGLIEEEIEETISLFDVSTRNFNSVNIIKWLISDMMHGNFSNTAFYKEHLKVAQFIFSLLSSFDLLDASSDGKENVINQDQMHQVLDKFIPVKDHDTYKCLGNSITLTIFYEIVPYSDNLIKYFLYSYLGKLKPEFNLKVDEINFSDKSIDEMMCYFFGETIDRKYLYNFCNEFVEEKINSIDSDLSNTKFFDQINSIDLTESEEGMDPALPFSDISFDQEEVIEQQSHSARKQLLNLITKKEQC